MDADSQNVITSTFQSAGTSNLRPTSSSTGQSDGSGVHGHFVGLYNFQGYTPSVQ